MNRTAVKRRTGFIHYSAPPVVGGVEAVMSAHARTFIQAGYPVSILAGRGSAQALPDGIEYIPIPGIDSQSPELTKTNALLESGTVPKDFEQHVEGIYTSLQDVVQDFGSLIIHNIFTKHFNLPLTAALHRLIDDGLIENPIAWCHDITWTSPNSRSKVHPGYPWDLIRTYRSDTSYVVVSRQRQHSLADLFGCEPDRISVIYNGVDPVGLLGLTAEGQMLVDRLELLSSDLIILMPVRITTAKNIEFALEVVAELKKISSSPKLVLTGPPDPHDEQSMAYYASLLELRDDLGVKDEMCFVFEYGPTASVSDEPYLISYDVVSQLYRLCDLVFMPSHREGFGMPILEAGLIGVPVASTAIPATQEIAAQAIFNIVPTDSPKRVAQGIFDLLEGNPVSVLRRRIRREYTWEAIFQQEIIPIFHEQEEG